MRKARFKKAGVPQHALAVIEWPTDLLGTVGRTAVLSFRSGTQAATVVVEQDAFQLSGPGKIPGADKFEFVFGPGDTFVRHILVRSKKSENSVAKVVVRVSSDPDPEPVVQEFQISISPLWGLLEYLNLAGLWFFLPKWIRRRLWTIPLLLVAVTAFVWFEPDILSDDLQARMHLAPPDWFETNAWPVWSYHVDDPRSPGWHIASWKRSGEQDQGSQTKDYLEIFGIAAPDLPGLDPRETLYEFHADIVLNAIGSDTVAWAFRFHPSSFPCCLGPTQVHWSAYVFTLSKLTGGSPELNFLYCASGACESVMPAPHLSIPGDLQTYLVNARGAVPIRITGNGLQSSFTIESLNLNGQPVLKNWRFADGQKRLRWGNMAFLSLGKDGKLKQGTAFGMLQVEIRPVKR